jgi:sulfite reductase beta subunit-like hemoprotein
MTKPDYKQYGFIPQRQPEKLIMRARNRAGNITAGDLRKVAHLAEQYGQGLGLTLLVVLYVVSKFLPATHQPL